jgi:hypothetical protein
MGVTEREKELFYFQQSTLTACCSNVLPSMTNKIQRYAIFCIAVNALHVSGGEYCIALHLVGHTWKNTFTKHGHMNIKVHMLFEKLLL